MVGTYYGIFTALRSRELRAHIILYNYLRAGKKKQVVKCYLEHAICKLKIELPTKYYQIFYKEGCISKAI